MHTYEFAPKNVLYKIITIGMLLSLYVYLVNTILLLIFVVIHKTSISLTRSFKHISLCLFYANKTLFLSNTHMHSISQSSLCRTNVSYKAKPLQVTTLQFLVLNNEGASKSTQPSQTSILGSCEALFHNI